MTIEEMELDTEKTLLQHAKSGNLDYLKRAIESGIDVNTPTQKSNPLYEAVSKGYKEIIEYLLSLKTIDVNIFAEDVGYAPIHSSIFYGSYSDDNEILSMLLRDKRTQIKLKSSAPLTDGFTALHIAAFIDYSDGMELLINYGASPHDKTPAGLTVYDVAGESVSCKTDNMHVRKKLDSLTKIDQFA